MTKVGQGDDEDRMAEYIAGTGEGSDGASKGPTLRLEEGKTKFMRRKESAPRRGPEWFGTATATATACVHSEVDPKLPFFFFVICHFQFQTSFTLLLTISLAFPWACRASEASNVLAKWGLDSGYRRTYR